MTSSRRPLIIDSVCVQIVKLPLLIPFTISTGTMTDKIFPLVTLRSGDIEGYAEGVMDPLPDYLDEAIAGALDLLREGILPQIIGQSFENPHALEAVMRRWRGHQMTKAVVEMAFWDLWAKSLGLPLKTVLGGSGERVDVGVSLGIGPIAETIARAQAHHDLGYKRIKLKIMPGHDVALVSAVRTAMPDVKLSVDANSAYSLSDMDIMRKLDELGLEYIEQPLTYNDLHDHAVLQSRIATPICLDESIRSSNDARKALQTDATRVINIKVGRVGGHLEAKRIHDLAQSYDVPVWCGGMLESGIGRAHNIHLSTLENFKKPGDTSSSSRYFSRDIIFEKLEAENGTMAVPQGTGIGVHLDLDYLDAVTISKEEFKL